MPFCVSWFFAVYGRPLMMRSAYASPIPGNAFSWSAVAVLISRSCVLAEGFAVEPVLFADDIAPELLLDEAAGFCDPEDVEVFEVVVLLLDCACSPGADIVMANANAANRPKNLLRTFIKPSLNSFAPYRNLRSRISLPQPGFLWRSSFC